MKTTLSTSAPCAVYNAFAFNSNFRLHSSSISSNVCVGDTSSNCWKIKIRINLCINNFNLKKKIASCRV